MSKPFLSLLAAAAATASLGAPALAQSQPSYPAYPAQGYDRSAYPPSAYDQTPSATDRSGYPAGSTYTGSNGGDGRYGAGGQAQSGYNQGGYNQGSYNQGPNGPGPNGQGGGYGDPGAYGPNGGQGQDVDPQELARQLALTASQQAAYQSYQNAFQPDEARERQDEADARRMAGLTTPQRLDMARTSLQRDRADFDRTDAATRAFYNQLTPAQRRTFDRLTAPQMDDGQGAGGPSPTQPAAGPR